MVDHSFEPLILLDDLLLAVPLNDAGREFKAGIFQQFRIDLFLIFGE